MAIYMRPTTANTAPAQTTYSIRPTFKDKFRPSEVRSAVKEFIDRTLQDIKYDHSQASSLSKSLSEQIRDQLRTTQHPRYKLMVQVVLGDKKGQAVRVGTRCRWDADTDSLASYTYTNDTLFCVVVVFACYLY